MLNKQSFIILINKFIGQIKSLFSRFANKFPKELITKHIVMIIRYKDTIKVLMQNFIVKIKTFKIKLLLDRLSNKKTAEIIPDGILGINISSNSIALVHLVFHGLNDIIVKSHQIVPLNAIDVNLQVQEQKTAIENIMTKYIQTNNLLRIACAYVLSTQQYVMSLIELPQAKDSAAIEKSILWSVKDYINYSIDDAILESFIIPVNRTQDNAKLAYAVAMRAKLSEEIGKLVNKCGARLKYIDINELCVRNIISLYPDMQPGCVVLKIFDANNSSILLIKDNSLFISRTTKLHIKELDNFDPTKDDFPEKLNIAEKLVVELQRSLDYGNSIFRDLHFNTMCILPHKFNLDFVLVWIGEQLGLPVRKIDLTQKIKFEKNINQEEQADCSLAIGAGLRNINNVAAN